MTVEQKLDPRLNAYRADLAAERLRGRIDAPRYAPGTPYRIAVGAAPLRKAPQSDAALETELLFGETVQVYDENEGWAWAQADGDSYVGYLPASALSGDLVAPTHRVTALRTFIYPAPDIKTPPLDRLSLNALLSVVEERDGFARLADGRFVHGGHIAPVGHPEADFVAVAERFLGTPYLWGGRTSIGLDCSALIQLSLTAAGVACPRDTDMQEAALGVALAEPHDLTALRRGDLVFWRGHVGVMADPERLLHANAHHMETVTEPLAEAVARIAASGNRATSIRRL